MIVAITCFISCSGTDDSEEAAKGKVLALKYCQNCHQLPDPSLLTKDVWNNSVLPVMGLYLGMNNGAELNRRGADSIERAVLPSHPAMDTNEWRLINTYFAAMAPEVMPAQQRIEPVSAVSFFTVQYPSDSLYDHVSVTSFSGIDTAVKPHRIFVGNAMTNQLLVLNDRLQLLQRSDAGGAVVDLHMSNDELLVCTIGKQVIPTTAKEGKITDVQIDHAGRMKKGSSPLFDRLARPVQVTKADLNGDSRPDYLICEFGNLAGELSWMENKGKAGYAKHILRDRPGALRTIVEDYNKDGLPDIWAQFAQGEEGIFLYTNKGNGRFEEQQVLRFPPSYGSTYFELADINGDGFSDIIYTCGDNADYSQILKPYHGVYIFLNDGRNRFTQRYFYPINGCYKALARDYDGDGDLDLAAISFYPAAATPWEAFVYLENKGGYVFQPYTLPAGTPFQKGMTMDAGDLDGDGKTDLLLGSGFFTSNKNGERQPLFVVLKNGSGGAAK